LFIRKIKIHQKPYFLFNNKIGKLSLPAYYLFFDSSKTTQEKNETKAKTMYIEHIIYTHQRDENWMSIYTQ
jgi:hypothetical protein